MNQSFLFLFWDCFFCPNPPKKSDNETVKKVHLLLYFVSSSVWFRILYLFCFSTLSDLTFLCHHPIKIFWVSCSSTFFLKTSQWLKWLKSVFDTFDKFSIHQLLTCSKGPKKTEFLNMPQLCIATHFFKQREKIPLLAKFNFAFRRNLKLMSNKV